MDPQFVFQIWLPVFATACVWAYWRDGHSRAKWATDYYLAGVIVYRSEFRADYGKRRLPEVELLDKRFGMTCGVPTEFCAISEDDIAFRDQDFPRSGSNLCMHGRLKFDRAAGRVFILGYANLTSMVFLSGLALFALLSMNAAAWAAFLFVALVSASLYWRRRDFFAEIGEYAAYAVSVDANCEVA